MAFLGNLLPIMRPVNLEIRVSSLSFVLYSLFGHPMKKVNSSGLKGHTLVTAVHTSKARVCPENVRMLESCL